MKKAFDSILPGRIKIVLLFFGAIFAALLGRLFVLQIVDYRLYADRASHQQNLVKEITSERGIIYLNDKSGNLIPVALNKIEKNLVVSPKDVKDPEKTAAILSKEFNLDKNEILKKLSKKDDPYEILLKKVDSGKADKVESMKLAGVYFEDEEDRVYPYGSLGAQLLGFVSKEGDVNTGRYGLESFYNEDLAGQKGMLEGVKDATGLLVALGRRIIHPPKNGSNLVLTLDYNIQSKAEEILKNAKEKWQASSGAVLVLDPTTGKILAMAANPAFDPNNFSKEKNFSVFLNPLVESSYELGSVLKPVTMAGGLEEGLVTPDTTYYDPGAVKVNSFTIKNFDGKAYKTQTMTQVLEKSLNTGAVFVAKLLGHDNQLKYIKLFGFGEKTGIDLPGELPGNISNLNAGRDVDFLTASFGQGIAVTPLQLIMAVSAIANKGNLMKPHVTERVVDDSGNLVEKEPELERQVISTSTAETLTKMLVSVVRNGFEDKAGVKGYFVAGKTGTAQIPKSGGRGYSDKVIHTFVGYAPAFNPKFLIFLQLNEPKGNLFAANTLTPFFHDLAQYILNYYEIPPDENQ